MQVLRPHRDWLWVQDTRPLPVPRDVLDVPGLRYIEPMAGHEVWRCEIPFTAWMLPIIRTWLDSIGYTGDLSDRLHLAGGLPPSVVLYKHQREAVDWIVANPHVLLADPMGVGKTAMGIAAATRLRWFHGTHGASPVLITGPKSVQSVWQRELLRMGIPDGDRFVACSGMKPDDRLRGVAWIFCHYDLLNAWWSFIYRERPAVGILDEAHLVRNGRTKRGKAVAMAISSAPCRLALTGTPILNRVGDAHYLFQLVTGNWTWGTPRQFRVRYAGAEENQYGLQDGPEVTNRQELEARLGCCYIRRELDEIGLSLPDHTRQLVEIEMGTDHVAKYKDAFGDRSTQEVVKAIRDGYGSRNTLIWLNKLRQITSRAKFKATQELIDGLLEEGESVVVFSWERAMAERLAASSNVSRALRIPTHVIHGGRSDVDRQRIIDAFQETGGVLSATIDSLSVGVTLHRARVVVMHDLDWVPAKMLQAEARVRRIGQQRPTISKWLICPNTIDELVARAFHKKAGLIADVVGDKAPQSLADLIQPEELYDGVQRAIEWARCV